MPLRSCWRRWCGVRLLIRRHRRELTNLEAMNSAETRFAHLLQPIRELTKNWDVDLATQLGEYLEELDQMTISFDGGKTMMNFAEAALLIQGSTCIYGRKVELLHSLVFQTLDCISNKTRRRDKQGSEDANGITDGTTANNDRDDYEFDVMEEEPSTQNVEMKSDPAEPVKIIRLPPESLIPVEALEKQRYPLFSLKGEVLGSCKDFRINNFTMDALGIICLGRNSSCTHFPSAALEGRAEVRVAVPNDNYDDNDVDDNGGGEELPQLEEHVMEVGPEPEEHVERHQAPSEKRLLRERPQVQPAAEQPKQQPEAVDPWKWLDPYENTGEDKTLKTGKCCNVPAGLEESGKRKRKGPSKLQDFWGWCSSVYENTDRKLKNGPLYPEFNYIYLSKMNQRLKTRKRILRKTGVYISDELLKRTYLEPEKQEDQDEVARHPDMDGEDYSDNENENLCEDHGPGNDIGEQDPIFTDSQMGRITYEDLVKKSVELFLVNSQKYAQETALSRRVKEWEDEINPRLSAQEEHPPFDIHDYGDRIVHALGALGVKQSFASLVTGMENTEACRYMLASLQLANDHTVEIDKKAGLEESIDTMELTLLSKQRAHERLKTYNATSDRDLP
ncbi:condensin-2 complex subunit H2 isoform X2 [Pygocentrus nattereri]|uniref:condensin-2 complex subunit H2 isoform X2 n=1 Tax=Pygocentrus nattereri TaxID=42514 RepID=UPI00081421F5|nr:condensin-2 complex subunit H2 isoform X2 [Pygocentrus nattereri]